MVNREKGKNGLEMADREYGNGDSDYRELIIEMVQEINNRKFLHFLYGLINSFKQKWGI